MIPTLENYLQNEYKSQKKQYEDVENLIKKTILFYKIGNNVQGWEYKLGEKSETYSISTNAMINFALSVANGNSLDLNTSKKGKSYIDDQNLFKSKFKESVKLITDKISEVHDDIKLTSSTFGNNDPFTLMWISYLYNNLDEDNIDCTYKGAFKDFCEKKIKKIFEDIYHDKSNVSYSEIELASKSRHEKIDRSHIFPLLKIIQLYRIYQPDLPSIHINEVLSILNSRLHYHLSLSNIQNSSFDAAELVFSLEGILLIDPENPNISNNTIKKVFDVIEERQKISLCWRPSKPFVSNSKGLALLPISVEIAMSLMRICRILENTGLFYFSEYYDIFSNYTDWLKTKVKRTRIVEAVGKHTDYFGWCSEHLNLPDTIHTWMTSQVLVYLINFNTLLQNHISNKSLELSNFTIKQYYNPRPEIWDDWITFEPFNYNDYKVYESIKKNYIDKANPASYSMILYGPPGTGKTTIAEKIAETKGWPLVIITPSNFIASGADLVESKAKDIFNILSEQRNIVVLFDEIDRLILDRDSKLYYEQSDIFQFMTPSMLVKINDLRSKKRIIFIISTNYIERIDKAIKRQGRIDNQYLVLPFDYSSRKEFFTSHKIPTETIDKSASKTSLFIYTELKHYIHNQSIHSSISLLNYKDRLGINKHEEKSFQKPITEFLCLFYLCFEPIIKKDHDLQNDELINIFDNDTASFLKDFIVKSPEMLNYDKGKDILNDEDFGKLNTKIKNNMPNDNLATKISRAFKILLCDDKLK